MSNHQIEDDAVLYVPVFLTERIGWKESLKQPTLAPCLSTRLCPMRLPGASGRERQIAMLEQKNIEVLVAGEAREWETVEYARDAADEGRPKALILLGHEASEEAGMQYCAAWLKTFIPEVPIEFIKAGEPFWRPA